MGKKEFAAATLDSEYIIYVVYVGSVSSNMSPSSFLLDVHSSWRPQISGLIVKETLTKVSAKYLNFTDIFFLDLMSELFEHTGINNHAIELVDSCQQLPYRPIYSLKLVELAIVKTYIKTNLVNGFIRLSKSPAGAHILFDRKSDGSLHLCVNY